MKIRFYSSVIFDALCACAELAEQKDRGNSEKQEFLALLREKTGDVFQGGALSFSTMCGIAARALPDPSNATLDELDKLFAEGSPLPEELELMEDMDVPLEFRKEPADDNPPIDDDEQDRRRIC